MPKLSINWILPRATLNGGVKSNRLIAEAMVRRGHNVRIAFLDRGGEWPSPRQLRRFTRHAISAWRARSHRRHHHLESSTAELIPVRSDRITAADVPDADVSIATWWETMEWMRSWPASKGTIAYFIRHHELHGGEPQRVKATYRTPCQKLVIARWLRRLMAEEYGDPNAVLVPNGVDRKQFDSTPRMKARTPTIGIMYSPVAWKGCETAFEAIRKVQAYLPDLQVVGYGPKELRPETALPANWEFHLRPPQTDIPWLYKRCDAWIMSSTSEGFGMPGLEAAACRCPIISTRSGGPEDYVKHGESGYLVPVGDADAMATRIRELFDAGPAAWQAMSEASYAVSQHFDWDRSAEILENTLLVALAAKAQRKAG